MRAQIYDGNVPSGFVLFKFIGVSLNFAFKSAYSRNKALSRLDKTVIFQTAF